MEDSNQTPLLLESVNAYVTDDVQATGLPSPFVEDDGIDEIMRTVDEIGGFTMDDYLFFSRAGTSPVDDFLAPFFPSIGNGPVMAFPASLYSNARNCPVEGFPASFYPSDGNGQVDGFPASLYPHAGDGPFEEPIVHEPLREFLDDYFPAPNDGRDQVIGEPPASPLVLSRQNPKLLNRAKIITCIAYVATVWSIVCLTMVFGVNKIGTIRIGMGSSLLLKPNRFFVETINVEELSKSNGGPVLYGFNNQPSLNVISSWSEEYYASLQPNIHKEWVYFLNEGSQINISYSVLSSKLLLTITRGSDGYGYDNGNGYCYGYGICLDDQSGPNTTLSWNIIQGNGLIQQKISQFGEYHISVENLNATVEEVELNISGRAFIYITNEAYYMCMLAGGRCVFHLLFTDENYAVLTTPRLKQGTSNGEWYLKLSYGPRWITLFGGIVVINGMMLMGIQLWKKYGCING